MVSETFKFHARIGAFIYNIFVINILIAVGCAFIYDDSAITDREEELMNMISILFFVLSAAMLRLTCSVLYPKIKEFYHGSEDVDVWGHVMSIGTWTTVLHFTFASTYIFWMRNDATFWTYVWFGIGAFGSMSMIAVYVVGLKKSLTSKVYLS